MATTRNQADDIQREMALIRSQLFHEMREVVDVVATVADWHSYIRARPWLAIGVAFGSGFFLAPRRARPPELIAQPSAPGVPTPAPAPQVEKRQRLPLIRWVVGAVVPIAIRAAQAYALKHVESLLENQPAGPQPEPTARTAPQARTHVQSDQDS